MRTTEFHLYIIDTTVDRAQRLKVELFPLPHVTVLNGYSDVVAASGGLDAIFVSLMSAIESGAVPIPAPLHQTWVVKMPDDEVARGRPPFAIPGVAISPGEVLGPVECTRLVLRESFRAINGFNQASERPLKNIGAVSSSLGFDNLKIGQTVKLLSEAYASFEA